MINFDDYADENKAKHNSKRPLFQIIYTEY